MHQREEYSGVVKMEVSAEMPYAAGNINQDPLTKQRGTFTNVSQTEMSTSN